MLNIFKRNKKPIKFHITIDKRKFCLPLSWQQVSIYQFQNICNIQTENELLYIKLVLRELLNIDIQQFDKIEYQQVEMLKELLKWVKNQPDTVAPEVFELKGKRYGFIPDLKKMTFGEWVDVNNYIKEPDSLIDNIHKLAAILYRPVVKLTINGYKIEDYNTESIEERRQLFQESASINSVYSGILFFCSFVATLQPSTKDYLTQIMPHLMPHKTK